MYNYVTCVSEGMTYDPYYMLVLSPGEVGYHDCVDRMEKLTWG